MPPDGAYPAELLRNYRTEMVTILHHLLERLEARFKSLEREMLSVPNGGADYFVLADHYSMGLKPEYVRTERRHIARIVWHPNKQLSLLFTGASTAEIALFDEAIEDWRLDDATAELEQLISHSLAAAGID